VGIERQHERGAPALGRTAPNTFDDFRVAAMQSVKVAQRQDWLMPSRRTRIVWKPGNLHGS
jgi:hypothetical protein